MELGEYMEKHHLSQRDFADLVGVTQSMVSQWVCKRRPISPMKAIKIEQATKGKIRRRDLLPEIFGKRAA